MYCEAKASPNPIALRSHNGRALGTESACGARKKRKKARREKRVSAFPFLESRLSATANGETAQKKLAANDPTSPIRRRQNRKRIAVVVEPKRTLGNRSQPSGLIVGQLWREARRGQRSPACRTTHANSLSILRVFTVT